MFVYFLSSFLLCLVLTPLVRFLALRFGVVDVPDVGRKRHAAATPLLGGIAIFFAFWVPTLYILFFKPSDGVELLQAKLVGALFAGFFLMLIGIADDVYKLSAPLRLGLCSAAILIALWFGLGLDKVTNPLGGILSLQFWPIILGGKTFFLLPAILVFLWLMVMMFTVKITDGLDGLSTGVVAIGAAMIFILTKWTTFYQPNVALLAAVFAGSCLGFLVFNFKPAKIFLGESGGLFLGFMLGVLAIISGGKVAITFLVMAIPIIDVLRVIYIRLRHRRSVFEGDRAHLHFELLKLGFSDRQVVLVFYFVSALFGAAALFWQTTEKLIALVALFMVVLFATSRLAFRKK